MSFFSTNVSRAISQYAAVAIGAGSDDVNAFLEKHYNADMSIEEAASLAIASINLKAEQKDGINHIKMAKITSQSKVFEKVTEAELQNYSQNATKFSPQ